MKKLLLVLGSMLAFWGTAFAEINVNTATREELESLKGIGPVKAQAIVEHRVRNGPFKSIEDLKKVPGIGAKTLDDIRKDVAVTGSGGAAAPAATLAKSESAKPKSDKK